MYARAEQSPAQCATRNAKFVKKTASAVFFYPPPVLWTYSPGGGEYPPPAGAALPQWGRIPPSRPLDVLPHVGENTPPSGWRRTPPGGGELGAGLRIKFSPQRGRGPLAVWGVKVLCQSFGKNVRTRIPPSSADADTSPRGQNLRTGLRIFAYGVSNTLCHPERTQVRVRIQVIKKCQCRALTTLIHLGCHAYTTTNAFGFSLVAYARNDQVKKYLIIY